MATYEVLEKLNKFNENYRSVSLDKSKVNDIATQLDNVISNFSQTANDSQCSPLKSYIVLAKDGNILTDYEMNELIRLADEQLMLTGIMIQRKGMYKKIKM